MHRGYDKAVPASGLSPKSQLTVISVDDELVLVKMTMFSVLYIRSVFRPDVLMPCCSRCFLAAFFGPYFSSALIWYPWCSPTALSRKAFWHQPSWISLLVLRHATYFLVPCPGWRASRQSSCTLAKSHRHGTSEIMLPQYLDGPVSWPRA